MALPPVLRRARCAWRATCSPRWRLTSNATARCTATPPCPKTCGKALPETQLTGEANLLICPNLDAANILFNVLKMTGGNGVTVGPILMGAQGSAHILTPSSTVRRVVNMTALAVADANSTR